MPFCIADQMDIETKRSPEHVSRWHAALRTGLAAAPRCEAVRHTGERCRCVSMRDARPFGIFLCSMHLRGPKRVEVDRLREPRLLRESRSQNTIMREQALRGLADIRRRRLLDVWKRDPTILGATIALDDEDEQRVARWLRDRGIDLAGPLPETGRPPTPRTVDRLKWAAVLRLGDRIDDVTAESRIRHVLRQDARYWHKRETAR